MRAPDDERLARVALGAVAEPNDVRLWRFVTSVGPVAALAHLSAGGAPPGGDRRSRDYTARLPAPDPAALLASAALRGARYVVPGDLEWPSQLHDLDLPASPGHRAATPPLGLWVRGELDLRLTVLRSAAVVGARAASAYGAHVAADLAAGLADRGWAVVSGAAYGIDAAAHRGALAAGGATVAVLACGVDLAYPRAHQSLLERVVAEGVVVSELPPGSTPTRARFLDRNRLIAALTPGTVVVEAAFRSGALNTATWARRLRRRLHAVPGPVTSPLSGGPHREVRENGAVLVTDAGEVVADLGGMGEALAEAGAVHQRERIARVAATRAHDGLSSTAQVVLDALDAAEWAPAGDVARRAALLVRVVEAVLEDLVAQGLAERSDAGWRAVVAGRRTPVPPPTG